MVHADKYHFIPQQGRYLQAQAVEITHGQHFPRLLWRPRDTQGCQIPIVEVQPSQPGTLEPLPSVRDLQNPQRVKLP